MRSLIRITALPHNLIYLMKIVSMVKWMPMRLRQGVPQERNFTPDSETLNAILTTKTITNISKKEQTIMLFVWMTLVITKLPQRKKILQVARSTKTDSLEFAIQI